MEKGVVEQKQLRRLAQPGSAFALGAKGQRFESSISDQTKEGNSLRARIGGESREVQ